MARERQLQAQIDILRESNIRLRALLEEKDEQIARLKAAVRRLLEEEE